MERRQDWAENLKNYRSKLNKQPSHPEVVEGVGCLFWVINEAVSPIVALREGDPELGVNVFHELSSIVHRLDHRSLQQACLSSDTQTLSQHRKKSNKNSSAWRKMIILETITQRMSGHRLKDGQPAPTWNRMKMRKSS